MKQERKYKVCTQCYTYNHEPFIISALEGFVIQQMVFPFVSLIIDDASTDKTADVIRQYLTNNFALEEKNVAYEKETDYGQVIFARHKTNNNCFFLVILLKENHYSKNKDKMPYIKEYVDNSEYYAICEGDDYWTDPMKLQKQVKAMEAHPELDISAHAYRRVNALTGEIVDERSLSHNESVFTMEQVIMGEGGFVGTPTLMIRQCVFLEKKQLAFWNNMDYDYTLQMAGALRGGMLFLSEYMVEKRTRVPGSFTNIHREASKQEKVNYNERKAKMLLQLDDETSGKYHNTIYARILLNNIRSYNTGKENRNYLHKYKDGLSYLGVNKRLSLYVLSYLSGVVKIYRLMRYGK